MAESAPPAYALHDTVKSESVAPLAASPVVKRKPLPVSAQVKSPVLTAKPSVPESVPTVAPPTEVPSIDFSQINEIREEPIDQSKDAPAATYEPSGASTWPLTASQASKAFAEAKHFAGGLIHHPSESNKHFSILRHSHGLVYFRGPKTSIAMSIFADAPLPADRSLWLQCKGYSGKTGMKLKTLLGADGSWLNVTPPTQITADQLKPADERAWQRDINHFIKRSDQRIRETHRLRETVIVHIPVTAEDGYFRLMLCTGENKKVLCGSPTFRLLSTTARPGMVKGASLSMLPFEVAAKIGSSAANTLSGNAISAVAAPYQQQIQSGQKVMQDGQAAYQVGQLATPVVQRKMDEHGLVPKDDPEQPGIMSKVKSGVSDVRRDVNGRLQSVGIRALQDPQEVAAGAGVFVVR